MKPLALETLFMCHSHFFSAALSEAFTSPHRMHHTSMTYGNQSSVQGLSTVPVYGDPQLYYQPSELRNVRSRRLM
jgi:hypothetical protein